MPTALAVQTSVRSAAMPDCAVAGCFREPRSGRALCGMHEKRRQRGTPLEHEAKDRLPPWARVLDAALDYANAPSEDDAEHDRREAALRVYIVRWIRSNGWVNPTATEQLANSVRAAVQDPGRGSGQQESSAPQAARPTVPERRLGKSGRDADVGEGHAQPRRQPRAASDRTARRVDGAAEEPARRGACGGSAPRPRRPQTVLPRARQARRDLP